MHSRLFKLCQIFKGANILKTGKRSEGHVLTENIKFYIFRIFLFCISVLKLICIQQAAEAMLPGNGVFMEFKRIDDTKFQCLLDEDDLEDNNISLDDFFRNDTKKIHGLLDVILEEAQKSIGIMMDGGVMSLQLAPQPNHTILLTISSGHDEFSDMIRNAGKMMTDRILSDIHDAGSNVIKKEDAGDAIKSAPFVPVEKLEEQIKNKLKKTANSRKAR